MFHAHTRAGGGNTTSVILQRSWSEEIDETFSEGRRHQAEQPMENVEVSFSIAVLSLRYSPAVACATSLNSVYSTLVLVCGDVSNGTVNCPSRVSDIRYSQADRNVANTVCPVKPPLRKE